MASGGIPCIVVATQSVFEKRLVEAACIVVGGKAECDIVLIVIEVYLVGEIDCLVENVGAVARQTFLAIDVETREIQTAVRTCSKQSAYVHSHHSISATHQYGTSNCKQSAATIDANKGEVVRELDITEGVVGGIEHANAMLSAIYQLFAHIGKGIAEVAHNVAVVGVEHLKRMFLLVEAVYSAAYRRYIDATIAVLADISESHFAQSCLACLIIAQHTARLHRNLVQSRPVCRPQIATTVGIDATLAIIIQLRDEFLHLIRVGVEHPQSAERGEEHTVVPSGHVDDAIARTLRLLRIEREQIGELATLDVEH